MRNNLGGSVVAGTGRILEKIKQKRAVPGDVPIHRRNKQNGEHATEP